MTTATNEASDYAAMAGSPFRTSRRTVDTVRFRSMQTVRELQALTQECGSPNWDGYGASPVIPETLDLARRLAFALPFDIPLPSVGAEADGHLTFEWYEGPRNVLSLSVSPEGLLCYAAHIGQSKRSGTEPFNGRLPEDVVQIVRRLTGKRVLT